MRYVTPFQSGSLLVALRMIDHPQFNRLLTIQPADSPKNAGEFSAILEERLGQPLAKR
jgi:hypothetical protein